MNGASLTCSLPKSLSAHLSKDTSDWPHVHYGAESGCVLESDCRGRTPHVPHAEGDWVEDASGTIGAAAFELLGELPVPE